MYLKIWYNKSIIFMHIITGLDIDHIFVYKIYVQILKKIV